MAALSNSEEETSLTKSLDMLKEFARPSPFGNISTGSTEYDESVCKALELTVDDGVEVRIEWLERILPLDHISEEREIGIQFDKINIYREGDFFETHKDTPRPDVVASVVRILNTDFEGGELEIDSLNDRESYGHGSNTSEFVFFRMSVIVFSP